MESALRAGAGAPGLKLIETMGWDGLRLVRLPLHMARLMRSAQALGWDCDFAAVERALLAAQPIGPARIRLTLDGAGQVAVVAADMPGAAAQWRIGLAQVRLQAGDAWLSVKSTQRAVYDTARAQMPAGLDEMVFQNQRGEVCDGSITSVFFDRGDGMRTPPLACGLLPGVLRAQMALPEEVLLARDLPRVRLWVGSSLRGLIPAVWVI